MAVYRRPARQRFVLLVVTLLSVTVITIDQRGPSSGVLGKVRSGAHDAIAPVQSAVGAVVSHLLGRRAPENLPSHDCDSAAGNQRFCSAESDRSADSTGNDDCGFIAR